MKTLMTIMVLAIVVAVAAPASAGILGPYTPDANTMHLWHFDEAAGSTAAADTAGVVGPLAPLPEQSAWPAGSFGNAAYDGTFGTSGRAKHPDNGAFRAGIGGANPLQDMDDLVGDATGAWTFEALVNHTAGTGPLIFDMQGGVNMFQYGPHAVVGVDYTKLGIWINGGAGSWGAPDWNAAQSDIIGTPGTWYHTAVTYNGLEGTPDNLKVYWTEMLPGNTVAAEVGSYQFDADIGTSYGYLSVGWAANNQNLLVDEVRISSVARGAGDMMFGSAAPPIPEPAGLGLIGLALLAVRRRRS